MINEQTLKAIEELRSQAYNDGLRDGIKKGRQEGIAEAMKAIQGIGQYAHLADTVAVNNSPFRPNTDSSKVYHFILENPGKRGNEIINELGVEAKLVRSALFRLKEKKIAENKDGWRLTER